MSYCRFSEGDVYLFAHTSGGICCMACRLADKVKSIFTTGTGPDSPIFKNQPPCDKCSGEGCGHCMMHGDTLLETEHQALMHIYEHIKAGDYIPRRTIERLIHEVGIMTVKDLKQAIEDLPDDMQIVLQKDSEGNGYSPLIGVDPDCIYIPDTRGSGEIYHTGASAEELDINEETWRAFKNTITKSLILKPQV